MTSVNYRRDLNGELLDAATKGDKKLVRSLLMQGAIIDQGNCGYDWTALLFAIVNGQLEVARYLVQQGASVNRICKGMGSGKTPLHVAVGHPKFARYLLEQGADRDKADNSGCTPLHYAAQYGCLETVMLLMSYGADLNARDIIGRLPIDMEFRITEEIKQAIRDEPRRRLDEAPGKRATEEDRHPNAATSASAQQEEEDEETKQSNKRPRLDDEGAAAEEEETKIAEEDEDSEPSSDEDNDD